MSDRTRNTQDRAVIGTALTRRGVLRGAGMLGLGVLGAGVAACKSRPDDTFADLSTEPSLVQMGGTFSGQLRGLLTGSAAANVVIRLLDYGTVTTDQQGGYALRVDRPGDYEVRFDGRDFHPRSSSLRISGSVALNTDLLESDAGLPLPFLDQFARGTGPSKEGVTPRTPGATNRWTAPPRVIIYRSLEDDDKDVVPDARLAAMQAGVLGLFGPLTGNALGGTTVEVRPSRPPASLRDIRTGTLVIGQRRDGLPSSAHTGSAVDPFAIVKARIVSGVDSSIEIFHRMFAHALGGWVVGAASDSILNPSGRATPSDRDRLAATFLYNRAPGNRAPDEDPAGAFLNA